MRALILIAGVALALGACRNNDQSGNTVNLDQGLTAENIISNDVTAIDAVTGADANMAADVNYVETPEDNGGTGNALPRTRTTGAAAATPASNASETAAPGGNATASATANNAI